MNENPYLSSRTDDIDSLDDEALESLPAVPAERPRVWTVFTVAVLGLVAAIGVQIVMAIAMVAWYVIQGADPSTVAKELPAKFTTPGGFILMGLPSQLAILLVAVFAAMLSPQATRQRLGLVTGTLPAIGYLLVLIGSIVPLAIGVGIAHLVTLVIPPDRSLEALYNNMTLGWAVPFVLFIALAPGIAEEVLFRGYMQRRFLERWKPWTAILVTSAIFAIYHVMPHVMGLAFVIGIWLGYMAWRSGSVLPGMCCHAFVNGGWNIWNIGIILGAFPAAEETPWAAYAVVGVVSLACMVFAIRMLANLPTAADIEPPTDLPTPELSGVTVS